MKKSKTIVLSLVVAGTIGLLIWSHARASRDSHFREQLTGAWEWRFANARETYNYSADGSYTVESVFTYSKSTNIHHVAGTWQIKDAKFILTITNDDHPRARVPQTITADILRLDDYKFMVGVGTNRTTLNRVSQ